jgi:hypothetical protein
MELLSSNKECSTMEQKQDYMRGVVMPVVVAVIVGVGSSYLATRDAMTAFAYEASQLHDDVENLQLSIGAINNIQIKLARSEEWRNRVDLALEILREEMSLIRQTRYTDKDSERDLKIIETRINALEMRIDNHNSEANQDESH